MEKITAIQKFTVRNQVRDAIQTFFKWSGGVSDNVEINNMLIHLDVIDNEFWSDNTTIDIKKMVNGKYELIESIFIHRYWLNYWNLVTEPWVCDLVNDITDIVMKHIEEPKKKGW